MSIRPQTQNGSEPLSPTDPPFEEICRILAPLNNRIPEAEAVVEGNQMPPPRAALYVRVATEKSAQEGGLVRQEQRLREWAEHNGYFVQQSYADRGSGNSEDRPALKQMMNDAQAGCFDAVLLCDPARLFRRLSLFRQYQTRLTSEFGVEVIFVRQPTVKVEGE